MYETLTPAVLEFADDGTPWSAPFGDVYHAQAGALGQARHVFLGGNALPRRWQGRERFVIVETGFGLGLNFLATWAAWRADAQRCERLHFVSFEKHPFRAEDLRRAHAAIPELAELSTALCTRWPSLTPGLHRLWLDDDRVVLTLYFGDALDGLGRIEARADAFYLDGFSPARNPELWSERVCHQLAALAAPDATLATWSVSGQVRRHLAYARFETEKTPGYAGKREMLQGRYTGAATGATQPTDRRAIVLGAGLAGTSIANRLARLGWKIEVMDAAPGPAMGASGNLAGVLRPLPSLDDNRLARLTRAGALAGRQHLEALDGTDHPARWGATGVLHLARDPVHERRQREVVEAHRPPADFLRFVDADEAGRICGWPVALGGWWFPRGAWVNPPSLCVANLVHPAIRTRFDTAVDTLERTTDGWCLRDAGGTLVGEAPVVILANGVGIRSIAQASPLPVRSARGQVSHIPATDAAPPNTVVCRLGYVTPAIDGQRCAGATFTVDDEDTALRAADHADNLAKLDFILPGYAETVPDTHGAGRVGFRPASPDRLPMVGAIPRPGEYASDARLDAVERHPGLYAMSGFGARGLVWSSAVADQLAAELNGDPQPLERDLREAIDPARFLIRRARRSLLGKDD
ncbi:bifunctional tRNA (5-methylaminomethyl-2-thiouridine)(34)-methyltransferase MnmD/FAD-dependent 5-carboxymethylaminomethyl-2-thiouridine(34) oxidoreductase MnmC [Nitrogeniibacter mangrovi]|uniref:tRNA 5-methylaminomethyl-2-thiouridine biosynthesis bifunctional protein MnmC n=1 Tax=Nitrogeniibacter mangrovi TaxID=2016596 RepID=A0A6C1B378_9RHOO|nr:bifunctional tRNA (5-methylaminomethyl-2-thiouridine)(34)-methyltransferase MnmD/FAD-dependent 5-carboxymethylaminomethyl-2-thiouridine(34) oxidoreductase MnmC [Nitrogeniibacter mangrovi]QID17843.1 bifunctional tRNA (5-methylaminomethyl-2-thiouridine)(34)-methyltransferase MnmD/FAD-dependent 5-carboxymethylaminomethyl-2-thiouridine(34) oxidoreductase MnmC [Nitrogeniibacter mangrovi]